MNDLNCMDAAGHTSPGNAADFESLLRSGMEDLMRKTGANQEAWGLGEEEHWHLDEGAAELIFTFPDLAVSTPAQVIGTWHKQTGIWTWAWAVPGLPEHLQADALKLRDYGAQHGFQHLVTDSWEAEESHGWYMTALACWLCGAKGAYRGATGETCTFMTFGDAVSHDLPEQTGENASDSFMDLAAEEFRHCLFQPQAQRQACCRFLKRGALQGIEQSELIHQLGLATPSVLDRAGYSPDAAQGVMDLLKTISDAEIEASDAMEAARI